MYQEVECPHCKNEFQAEVFVSNMCPKCSKPFIWDAACEGTEFEYNFPSWD